MLPVSPDYSMSTHDLKGGKMLYISDADIVLAHGNSRRGISHGEAEAEMPMWMYCIPKRPVMVTQYCREAITSAMLTKNANLKCKLAIA
jgi:hypothetical protein